MLQALYRTLFVNPLRKLYLEGPSVYQVGFWEGRVFTDICRELTSHSELFWETHPRECLDIIERKFGSFVGTLEVIMYFYCMYLACDYISSKFLRPRNPILHLYVPVGKENDHQNPRIHYVPPGATAAGTGLT